MSGSRGSPPTAGARSSSTFRDKAGQIHAAALTLPLPPPQKPPRGRFSAKHFAPEGRRPQAGPGKVFIFKALAPGSSGGPGLEADGPGAISANDYRHLTQHPTHFAIFH